ncbi:MAG: hypothetical protein O3A01_03265, partial [bacterium]|nr:hypothetical protein [bacterium]
GWAFIHQHAFSPESADLIPLRKAMVKRPVLATIEKLMMPIRATKTLLITGYTHPPYRDMLTNLMKNLDYIHTSIIIRGVEGATLLPLDRQAPFTPLHGTRNNKQFTRPTDWGITEQELPSIETPTAEENLKVGLSILRNEPSAYRDQMLYYCASIATFAGRQKAESLEAIQHALESGNALKRWEQAQNNAI